MTSTTLRSSRRAEPWHLRVAKFAAIAETAVDEPDHARLLDVADRNLDRMADVVASILAAMAASLTGDMIAAALRQGSWRQLAETATQTASRILGEVRKDDEGALLTQIELDVMGEAALAFNSGLDLTDPFVIAAAQANAAALVTGVSAQTVDSLRAAVTAGVSGDMTRPQVERAIRGSVTMTGPQHRAYMNLQQSLNAATKVDSWDQLPAAQRASLRRVREYKLLDGRMSKPRPGMTRSQADAVARRYEERAIRHRAETIARTETMRAANSGRMESMRQSVRDGFVTGVQKVWSTGFDDRTCEQCAPLDGTVVALDIDFEETQRGGNLGPDGKTRPVRDLPKGTGQVLDFPPLHPRCRCTILFENVTLATGAPATGIADDGFGIGGRTPATYVDDPMKVYSESPVPERGQFSPATGDAALRRISETQGFNGRPTLVSQAQLDAEIERGGIRLFRGETDPRFKESFMRAESLEYHGQGIFGNGSYWAGGVDETVEQSLRTARSYTNRPVFRAKEAFGEHPADTHVMSGALRADARTITHRDAQQGFERWREAVRAGEIEAPPTPSLPKIDIGPRPEKLRFSQMEKIAAEQGEAAADAAYDEAKRAVREWDALAAQANGGAADPLVAIADEGRWAAAMGYDAIIEAGAGDYNVILNRTALLIVDM
jgi:hypothetical protein